MEYYSSEQLALFVRHAKAFKLTMSWMRKCQNKTGTMVQNNELIRYYQRKLGERLTPGEMKSLIAKIR